MAADGTKFVTANNRRTTVLQTLVTERQPPLTSTHLPFPSEEHMQPKQEEIAPLYTM